MKFSLLSIVVIVLSSMICVYGQKETSFVCRDAEVELTKEFQKWTKTTMKLFGNNCTIEFQMGDDFISVWIQVFETIDESQSEFSSKFDFLTFAETYPKAVKSIKSTFWNESKGFNHHSDSDRLILLRYKRILITLIGSKYNHLLRSESVLRRIDFDGVIIK